MVTIPSFYPINNFFPKLLFFIIFELTFYQKYFFCNFLFAFSVQKINYFQYISVVFIIDIKISILSSFSLALKTVAILCGDKFKKSTTAEVMLLDKLICTNAKRLCEVAFYMLFLYRHKNRHLLANRHPLAVLQIVHCNFCHLDISLLNQLCYLF